MLKPFIDWKLLLFLLLLFICLEIFNYYYVTAAEYISFNKRVIDIT